MVEYSTRGAAPSRRFVVTFTGVPTYSGGGTVTTQVILHEGTNHIEVHTTTQNAATYLVTQGVEDATGSVAYFLAGRVATNYHLSNDAVLFVTN